MNYVFDDRMLKHAPRPGTPESPERPERILDIRNMFANSGLDQRCIETVVSCTNNELINAPYSLKQCFYRF